MLDPEKAFSSENYQTVNRVRLEHLASLGLDLERKTVLELGAGIGDLTQFFIDRGCAVTSTEGRPENLVVLQRRFPGIDTMLLDLEKPPRRSPFPEPFDVVFAYGILYHLGNPEQALTYMAHRTRGTLLVETHVSFGDKDLVHYCDDVLHDPTQSVSGQACRPTRRWIFNRLSERFEHVYMPTTQPNYPRLYPENWQKRPAGKPLGRAVFVASRTPIDNPLLVADVPMEQKRIA
jgi:SAM-dependent methyltransferase